MPDRCRFGKGASKRHTVNTKKWRVDALRVVRCARLNTSHGTAWFPNKKKLTFSSRFQDRHQCSHRRTLRGGGSPGMPPKRPKKTSFYLFFRFTNLGVFRKIVGQICLVFCFFLGYPTPGPWELAPSTSPGKEILRPLVSARHLSVESAETGVISHGKVSSSHLYGSQVCIEANLHTKMDPEFELWQ